MTGPVLLEGRGTGEGHRMSTERTRKRALLVLQQIRIGVVLGGGGVSTIMVDFGITVVSGIFCVTPTCSLGWCSIPLCFHKNTCVRCIDLFVSL